MMREALQVSITVFIAIWANHYLSFTHEYWLVATAFFASQTTKGAPIRQALIVFVAMIALVFLLSFTVLPMHSLMVLRDRLIDVGIGALIAILCQQVIFPFQFVDEFRLGLLPTVRFLKTYSDQLTSALLQDNPRASRLDYRLQENYPEWVYDTGFNRALRAGFRFFLIYLERVCELYCSLNYYTTQALPVALLSQVRPLFREVMQRNELLLDTIETYLSEGKLKIIEADFTDDIEALQQAVRALVPANLELLELSPDDLTLSAIVRDVVDLRRFLLRLTLALPS